MTIWIGLCRFPSLAQRRGRGGGRGKSSHIFRPLLLAPAQESQTPKAKQSWAHSELNISLTALLQLPVKHVGLSWMTSIFQKWLVLFCFFFLPLPLQRHHIILAQASKTSSSFTIRRAGSLALWSLSQRLKTLGMFSGKRKKKEKKKPK